MKTVFKWAIKVHFNEDPTTRWYQCPRPGHMSTGPLWETRLFDDELSTKRTLEECKYQWGDVAEISAHRVNATSRYIQTMKQHLAQARLYAEPLGISIKIDTGV